ncbi:DUF4350 domain-containing protein [Methylomonas sp. OY6]|uniref:DUF4350 domain-containing protein n=1 Tax=Methylomonas defluvii TaxID=3045149 RepID=A0ABU4UH55_9GAMM|nr:MULTISPECIES: DUF4350 domain-containing protein [unclassified Methylomonas]MDX8128649.1 DUF4350 domain-containing protein [Methylomonas sp. OY6]PKD40265.1 hypothetical protein CWO84_11785 [Methylomonas sp. Kb3]
MKERLITLLTALAALALVILLLSPRHPDAQKPLSLPTSEDRGADGLKGLFTWLQREGLNVVSFRKRYSDLHKDKTLPERGNVLIASMPASKEIRETEWPALADWLEQGNTLIVLGAVYQHPGWAAAENCFCDVKELLSRYDWILDSADQQDEPNTPETQTDKTLQSTLNTLQNSLKGALPQDSQLLAQSSHPLLQGVTSLQTQTSADLLKAAWTLSGSEPENLSLRLLSERDSHLTTAWWMNAGAGRIVLLLTPDLFSNQRLGQADNARFIGNLLKQSLAPAGRLLFDDYHFGLSELYDPEHFFKDQRLHQTLWCFGIFWLLYVAGYTSRLAPVRQAGSQLSTRDFIKVNAEFFARRLNQPVLAEALVKHLLADIHARRGMRSEAEVWLWLEQHSRVSNDQITLLKRALAKQRLSLLRLSNTITYIRTVTL